MDARPDTVRAHARVPRWRARGRTPAALVLALVVGVLGMHALGGHGTVVAEEVAYGHSMAAAHSHGAGSSDMAADAGHAERTAAAAHDGPGHGSMLTLCVFIVLGAAVALLVRLVGGLLRRPLLPRAFLPAPVVLRLRRWAGGAGPPPAWQFSVIRC